MINRSRFIFVYLLLVTTWVFIHFQVFTIVPVCRPLEQFPAASNGWRMISQSKFSEKVLNVLKPSDYLSRQYAGPDGSKVGIYVGYHDGGKESGEIHSPKHCLPGSGWYKLGSNLITFPVQKGELCLVKAVYRKGENSELFLYWFQAKGKTISNEYSLKLAEITNSMLHHRKDSAFIRVSVPFEGDEAVALATGIKFVRDFFPLLQEFLPS